MSFRETRKTFGIKKNYDQLYYLDLSVIWAWI